MKPRFNMIMGVIIVANCVSVGLESSYGSQNIDVPELRIIETIFLIMYTVELGLRFFAYGLRCLDSFWVRFDAFLVVVTWLNVILIEPNEDHLGAASQIARPFIVLRAVLITPAGVGIHVLSMDNLLRARSRLYLSRSN